VRWASDNRVLDARSALLDVNPIPGRNVTRCRTRGLGPAGSKEPEVDYPLLNLFWTMLWFFLLLAWFWVLVGVISDIFRSPNLSGWVKAGWTLFVIVLPWLGVVVYLIARGDHMHERYAGYGARS
jgi:Phospholipase_D-nuclease N-terminal